MASGVEGSPLDDNDLAALNRVLETAAKHRELLKRCKACDLPVDEHIARNEMHTEMAGKLKQQFFPLSL